MAEQIEPVSEDLDEEKDSGSNGVSESDMHFVKVFGFIAGYFVLSGTIASFLYLRWLGISQFIANSIEPLGGAATGFLGVVVFFINYILLGILLVNAESVTKWLQDHSVL